jgi:DNA-binding transcriptional MocR family regulator
VSVVEPLCKDRSYLYLQLADRIGGFIEDGTLRPGERVPSVRRLSSQHDVSVSSVLQAYLVLENRGLIEARPQSGYYVRPRLLAGTVEPAVTRSSPPAEPGRANLFMTRLMRHTEEPGLIQFGSGNPHPSVLPVKKLNRMLGAVARRVSPATNDYDLPAGNLELRRQIARRSLDWGCALATDELITTFGCLHAISLCLRAVAKPGDTIAVESPTWSGLLRLIENLGMKTLQLSTFPRHGICLDATYRSLSLHKVAAFVLTPNFQNPLGSRMPDEKKEALVGALARKGIPLIEDDVFGDLQHEGPRPKVAKAFDKRGMVLLCSSFSKTLAPGYRVGWCVPGKFREKVELLKSSDTISGAVLPELAVAEFLKNGGFDYHLRQQRRHYARQMAKLSAAICEHFPKGTKVTRPTGGFLLWVELPKNIDALELHRAALARKINFAPGPLFSPNRGYRNSLRISCSQPWSEQLEHALATLGQLAGKMS